MDYLATTIFRGCHDDIEKISVRYKYKFMELFRCYGLLSPDAAQEHYGKFGHVIKKYPETFQLLRHPIKTEMVG